MRRFVEFVCPRNMKMALFICRRDLSEGVVTRLDALSGRKLNIGFCLKRGGI